MTPLVVGFPPGGCLKGLFIQGKEIEITEQEPLGVEEVEEFVEPADHEFVQAVCFDRDYSGLCGAHGLRIGDHVKKGLCGMAEQISQAVAEGSDAEVSGMIQVFELAHVTNSRKSRL